ncbi:hypothetical protein BDZ94DRAFT_1244735, partial [Collybia nuda]
MVNLSDHTRPTLSPSPVSKSIIMGYEWHCSKATTCICDQGVLEPVRRCICITRHSSHLRSENLGGGFPCRRIPRSHQHYLKLYSFTEQCVQSFSSIKIGGAQHFPRVVRGVFWPAGGVVCAARAARGWTKVDSASLQCTGDQPCGRQCSWCCPINSEV